jgi:hypothetical protein
MAWQLDARATEATTGRCASATMEAMTPLRLLSLSRFVNFNSSSIHRHLNKCPLDQKLKRKDRNSAHDRRRWHSVDSHSPARAASEM